MSMKTMRRHLNSSEGQQPERWITLGVGDDTGGQKLSCILCGNAPWQSCFRKHDGRTQKVNTRTPILLCTAQSYSHRVLREHGQECCSEPHERPGVSEKPAVYPKGNRSVACDGCPQQLETMDGTHAGSRALSLQCWVKTVRNVLFTDIYVKWKYICTQTTLHIL